MTVATWVLVEVVLMIVLGSIEILQRHYFCGNRIRESETFLGYGVLYDGFVSLVLIVDSCSVL